MGVYSHADWNRIDVLYAIEQIRPLKEKIIWKFNIKK
jgi:hypothetical protein